MKVVETDLPGCVVMQPEVFGDERGFFYESFNHGAEAQKLLLPPFVQGNVSFSKRGVLRGLHYQWSRPQGKYLTVLQGEVWDVAVDLRQDSPTFGRWMGVVLNDINRYHLWIPAGFAHGFVVLSEGALVSYLCTETYDRASDGAVRWDDPVLGIDWPVSSPLLSHKDSIAPLLADVPRERLPLVA
jgi:dTDP-4-dehydrorhamnose 3,5-epimerase